MERRRYGSGGLTYIRGRDLWRATLAIPGQKLWVATSRSRSVAEARLAAKKFEVGWVEPPDERPSRRDMERAARALGTHTEQERLALYRATRACRYCHVALDYCNAVPDHITPISRGGSDAIGNIQWICWQCNIEKGDLLDFTFTGTRPYAPMPPRREYHAQLARAGRA